MRGVVGWKKTYLQVFHLVLVLHCTPASSCDGSLEPVENDELDTLDDRGGGRHVPRRGRARVSLLARERRRLRFCAVCREAVHGGEEGGGRRRGGGRRGI